MIIKIKSIYRKAYTVRLCNDIGEYNLINKDVCKFFGLDYNTIKYLTEKNNCFLKERDGYNFLFCKEVDVKNFSKDIIKLKLFFNGE